MGTAALVKHDMATRKELTPWLAGVYVVKEMRKKGIGTKLVKHVINEAGKLGIKKLYLFTPDMLPFYKKMGWNFKEKDYYLNMDIDRMEIEV